MTREMVFIAHCRTNDSFNLSPRRLNSTSILLKSMLLRLYQVRFFPIKDSPRSCISYAMYRSPYPEPFVPSDVSVSQFLLSSNPDDVPPDQQILSDFDNQEQTLTIQELHSHAERDASTLISRFGLREGDVVCIFAPNSISWVTLAHAILWAGGCFWSVYSLKESCTSVLTISQRYQLDGNCT